MPMLFGSNRIAARRIATKRPLPARLWRRVRAALLRYEIDSDEAWLALCIRNGYEEPVLRRRIGEARVQLALLESGR